MPSLTPSPTAAELDLRDLPAPEPMVQALSAAAALQPGQSVAVWTPLVPEPLLELLRAQGLQTTVSIPPDGGARVLIHRPDPDPQPILDQRPGPDPRPSPDPRHDDQTAA